MTVSGILLFLRVVTDMEEQGDMWTQCRISLPVAPGNLGLGLSLIVATAP